MEKTQLYDGRMLTHHPVDTCKGPTCPLHRPSGHEFIDLPLDWNQDWGVMMRVQPDGTKVIDPDEYKIASLKPGESVILQNSGTCAECGSEMVSLFTHDFVSCKCGASFVDGGQSYLRRGGKVIDTSIIHKRSDA